MGEAALLEVRGLVRRFGGRTALGGVDLDVREGEIVGVIGPNGAGKTTLFNCVSGALPPTAGEVFFAGRPIHGQPAHRIAALGIGRTFQIPRPFRHLSVLENVVAGLGHGRYRSFWAAISSRPRGDDARRRAGELLQAFELAPYADHAAERLPLGLQRRLEIARAVALQPRLLMLDEPAAGLTHGEAEGLLEHVFRLRDRGVTVLLIEHNMHFAMRACDRIAVLNYGEKIATGPPAAIRQNPQVVEVYLGR